jgi:hypothetical protein
VNPSKHLSFATRCVGAAGCLLATSVVMARDVQLDAACVPQLTNLEHRLYQLAGAGPDALRQFIWSRRGIYQLDALDTATWVGDVDAARSACVKVGAAAPAAAGARS